MVHESKVRQDFAQRLAIASLRAGLSEHGRGSTIAKQLGISPKAVSKWFNAETMPRNGLIQHLAAFLGVDPVWLQMGISREQVEEDSEIQAAARKYPLVTWNYAGRWCNATADEDGPELTEWFTSDSQIKGKAFWLRVQGDVMSSPVGISLTEGMIVLVDPGREANNGSLVVALLTGSGGLTLRKLVSDGWQRFLTPLNPAYPTVPIQESVNIIGVVVEAKIQLI